MIDGNLADEITLTNDTGSVKNCFKLQAGDDLMTATVAGCNPDGSDYIWFISDHQRAEMSKELATKTAYNKGKKVTGTMPNNGAVSGSIAAKEDSYTVPQGYHDGSGTVSIDETEKAKIIPANIRKGVTVLGVAGSMSGTEGAKPQSKTVTSSNIDQTILPDEDFNYLSQVVVKAMSYVESANSAGGTTVTIG